jgi:hypothetical protein
LIQRRRRWINGIAVWLTAKPSTKLPRLHRSAGAGILAAALSNGASAVVTHLPHPHRSAGGGDPGTAGV